MTETQLANENQEVDSFPEAQSNEDKFLGVKSTVGIKEEDSNIEIEVVDDRPEEDRKSPRKEEDNQEEIEELSGNANKRIQKLKYDYHEERREKEQAIRLRDEAVNYAKNAVNENQRLIEKYAAKGKDFTKTEQYRQNMRYLDGVSVNRGGNRGRIYSNDPTLNSPSAEGNAYRRKLLAGEGPANRYALGKQGILNIDTDLARAGLEGTDHYFRFNQQLGEKNPKAYEEARPWASGAMLRNMAKMALPLPLKLLTNIAGAAGRGITNLIPKGMKEDLSWEGKKFMKSADLLKFVL